MKRWNEGMRDFFFKSLFNEAKKNKDLILITADTGAICHDDFKEKLNKQYINVGIAEQNMVGLAAGLSLSGKLVYIYGIIPFVTMRCYEQIRVDLCCMNLPVNIVGVGAGFDYSTLGATHHGTEDIALMRALPRMTVYSPADGLMANLLAKGGNQQIGPSYIRLDRTGLPFVYKNKKEVNFSQGLSIFGAKKDLYIISTGRMTHTALQVAKKLSSKFIKVGVIDLFRIKPLNKEKIWDTIKKAKYVVTLEEHFINGGIGSAIASLIAGKKNHPEFKSLGIADRFCSNYGKREYLRSLYGLDIDTIIGIIKKWIKSL